MSVTALFHILFLYVCFCVCVQIIPSLIHSMFYLLRDYQVSHSIRVFAVLRKGEFGPTFAFYMCVCVCVCVCVCKHVCMCMCMCKGAYARENLCVLVW